MEKKFRFNIVSVLFAAFAIVSTTLAGQITVTVENLSPGNGTIHSPVWVGFHDGSFDTFDAGSAAPGYVEMVAEDGNPAGILGSFAGYTSGVVFGPGDPPIFQPGDTGTLQFDVDFSSDVYLSFLSMVVPSNDAFIGNDDPMAFKLVDNGVFTPLVIDIPGSWVWDAGTEVNDEVPAHTGGLAQTSPNTGVTENGVIRLHEGYMDNGNILTALSGADFTIPDYDLARITVTPEPTTMALLGLGGLAAFRSKRRHNR